MALLWLTSSAVWAAPALAHRPLTTTPYGTAWLAPFIVPGTVETARALVLVGAMLGLFGLASRLGFALVAVGGLLVLGVPQFQGAVQHHHHLWWFAVLLAVSPASDALSVRRWRAAPGASLAWGLPVRVAWLLLAAIYWFPGLHKLRVQGLDWAGPHLVNTLHWKWAQAWDFVPLTRLDHWPTVLWLGGLGVLAFELGAPLLLLHRRTRVLFVVIGLVFHVATELWFAISFWSLLVCLVVLLPGPVRPGAAPSRAVLPSAVVGGFLLIGVGWTGATARTQAWPFACYPTFEQPIGPWMPTLLVVPEGGEPLDERLLADDGQQFHGEIWGLLGLYDRGGARGLEVYWSRVRRRPAVVEALAGVESVGLHQGWRRVDPDQGEVRLGAELANLPAR